MARFDVYEYKAAKVPYVLDVQANLLSDLNTVVVLPLVPKEEAYKEVAPKLKPVIQVNGQNYILMTTDIGTLARSTLGKCVVNIENEHRQDIVDALDFLFQGF